METKVENLYIIGYGLGGGFGGIRDYEVIESDNLDQAHEEAYFSAKEEYQRYEGMYGLESEASIIEELGVDYNDDDLQEMYNEEVDRWVDYTAEPWSRELEEKYSVQHYQNDYSEITDKVK